MLVGDVEDVGECVEGVPGTARETLKKIQQKKYNTNRKQNNERQ
jgi:hypothetical protein